MAADDEQQGRGVTMSNSPEQGPVATLAGSDHQIAPSPAFAAVVWAGVTVAAIAAVATVALALVGKVAAATTTLATVYVALTVAGRRWSQ